MVAVLPVVLLLLLLFFVLHGPAASRRLASERRGLAKIEKNRILRRRMKRRMQRPKTEKEKFEEMIFVGDPQRFPEFIEIDSDPVDLLEMYEELAGERVKSFN